MLYYAVNTLRTPCSTGKRKLQLQIHGPTSQNTTNIKNINTISAGLAISKAVTLGEQQWRYQEIRPMLLSFKLRLIVPSNSDLHTAATFCSRIPDTDPFCVATVQGGPGQPVEGDVIGRVIPVDMEAASLNVAGVEV